MTTQRDTGVGRDAGPVRALRVFGRRQGPNPGAERPGVGQRRPRPRVEEIGFGQGGGRPGRRKRAARLHPALRMESRRYRSRTQFDDSLLYYKRFDTFHIRSNVEVPSGNAPYLVAVVSRGERIATVFRTDRIKAGARVWPRN